MLAINLLYECVDCLLAEAPTLLATHMRQGFLGGGGLKDKKKASDPEVLLEEDLMSKVGKEERVAAESMGTLRMGGSKLSPPPSLSITLLLYFQPPASRIHTDVLPLWSSEDWVL